MKRFELIILIGAITFSLVISWLIVFNSNFFKRILKQKLFKAVRYQTFR